MHGRVRRAEDANELFRALVAMDMAPEVIRMYGRNFITKRRSIQFGADYDYNATAKRAEEWTSCISAIRERVESVTGPVNGALVQSYPDGKAGIGWHRDAGQPEVIASLSLGAQREFGFGVATGGSCKEVWRMPLKHGSLLIIPGTVNGTLKHRVPVARLVKEPRVSVTFRRFAKRPSSSVIGPDLNHDPCPAR